MNNLDYILPLGGQCMALKSRERFNMFSAFSFRSASCKAVISEVVPFQQNYFHCFVSNVNFCVEKVENFNTSECREE